MARFRNYKNWQLASCRGTGCSRVESRVKTSDFWGLLAPYVSWSLGVRATAGPLVALLWPGCAHTARGKIRCRGGIGPEVGS